MPKVFIKRGTRSQLDTAKTASGLNAGELYLITDESRVAVGTAANDYSVIGGGVPAYGADPSGATDSSSAIQAAIDAAYAAGGGSVDLPAGQFLLSTALETYPTVTIRGAGRRATVLKANTNGMSMIFCETPADVGAGVVIRDMTLISNGKSSVTGIKLHGLSGANEDRVSNIFLSDLEMLGASTEMAVGIDLMFCVNVKLSSIWIALATTGVSSDNSADVDMNSVTVQSGTGFGFSILGDGTAGVGYSQDEGYRLVGCNTNGQHGGLYVGGQDWGTASSCSFTTANSGPLIIEDCTEWKFSACEFSANSTEGGTAAYVLPKSTGTVTRLPFGIQFIGCTFSIADYGLLLNGDRHTVTGCTFNACDYHDLWMGTACATRYCSVSGNTFNSGNVNGSIREDGTSHTTNYNSFVGNTIRLGSGSGLVRVAGGGANSLHEIPTDPVTPLNVFY